MSEHEDKSAGEAVPASLLQRFRLPLMIGGGVIALLVFLLIGIMLGSVRLKLERKQFAEQMVVIKQQIEKEQSERKIQEAKVESFRLTAENRKIEIAELSSKLACFEEAASQAAAAELIEQEKKQQEPPVKVEPKSKSTVKPKAEEPAKSGYVRFGNASCTLIAGNGSTNWKECLKLGKPVDGAKPAATAPAKESPKPTGKPAEPHAKPAH